LAVRLAVGRQKDMATLTRPIRLWSFVPSFQFVTRWRKRRTALAGITRAAQVEIEVLRSYDRAINKVGHPGTADQLAQFRNEHAKHLQDLFASHLIARRFPRRLREEGRSRHPGFSGRVAMADDTEGALREVLAVEEVCSRGWDAMSADDLPPVLGKLVTRFNEDEHRHMRFLRRLIDTHVWELEESVPETP
jgi:hypothetical protein